MAPKLLFPIFISLLILCCLIQASARADEERFFVEDPTSPLIAWENEFKAQMNGDATHDEHLYRDFLAKVRDHLVAQGINTQIMIDYKDYRLAESFGRAWLKILPGKGNKLNQLAATLAQDGFTLQYLDRFGILNQDTRRPRLLFIKSDLQRWYLNARALSNIEGFLKLNLVPYGIALAHRQNLDPLAGHALYDFVLNYQNPQNLAWDQASSLPYLAHLIDEGQNIFVPYNSLATTGRNPEAKFVSIDHYRATKALSLQAQHLRELIIKTNNVAPGELNKIVPQFFQVLNNVTWRIIDLNAILYIMLERPWDVYFLKYPQTPHRMRIFINPDPAYLTFAYVLDIPWEDKVLADGDTSPIFSSPDFQMFYRYNLEIFLRLQYATYYAANFATLNRHQQIKFLTRLARLGDLPNKLAAQIEDHLWDHNELRINLGRAQQKAIYGAIQGMLAKERAATKNKMAPADFCAHQVTPPQNKNLTGNKDDADEN